jgi:hypothetical protein
LLIVSIGTGHYRQPLSAHAIMMDAAALQGLAALQSLMDDCERMNRATLQWLTNCLTPWFIDRALGDMKLDGQAGPSSPPTFASCPRHHFPSWRPAERGSQNGRSIGRCGIIGVLPPARMTEMKDEVTVV